MDVWSRDLNYADQQKRVKRSKQYDESRDEKPIEGRIRRHIDHLRKEHNLRVTNESGIWKIVLAVWLTIESGDIHDK